MGRRASDRELLGHMAGTQGSRGAVESHGPWTRPTVRWGQGKAPGGSEWPSERLGLPGGELRAPAGGAPFPVRAGNCANVWLRLWRCAACPPAGLVREQRDSRKMTSVSSLKIPFAPSGSFSSQT